MKTLEQQLAEAQAFIDSIKLQIKNKPKFPPAGTICEVWDKPRGIDKKLCYSTGDNHFSVYKTGNYSQKYDNFKPLEMGLTFSDEVMHSEDITPEIHKQLALCWDNEDTTDKRVRMIDSKYKCTYGYEGTRAGFTFDNYQLCTTPVGNLPQWAKDMINACED